ncbi:P60-like protein, partial [Fistulina hepatica ATCC 64428]
SAAGAPSQYSQSSRKGKRAWRKNIDIAPVEEGLEVLRQEERVIGTSLQKQQDQDLFQIDINGEDAVRKRLPKFSERQLTSTKIIGDRSAIPAVFARHTAKRAPAIGRDEKERLLRIAKRPRRGPFNAVMDHTGFGAGSAIIEVSEAVKQSGGYDPWAEESNEDSQDDLGKVPHVPSMKEHIAVPAVEQPHQGASYNPPVQAHQALLLEAHKAEEKRAQDADKFKGAKEKMLRARVEDGEAANLSAAPGMIVDVPGDDETESEGGGAGEGPVVPVKQAPPRKTRQQRAKAAKQHAEKLALLERVRRKRFLASIDSAKSARRTTEATRQASERVLAQRELAMRERLRKGLRGQKIGKYRVPEAELEVQLGEDLSDSLRGLKPAGNLFRDRFLSMQNRALVEPRARVLPTKRKYRFKEYEKHAWKRF